MARRLTRSVNVARVISSLTHPSSWGYWSRRARRFRNDTRLPEPIVSSAPMVRCREIAESDLEGVINLLTRGFGHSRDRSFWENAVRSLQEHCTPPGLPRFGYLLDNNGASVGVLLMISSARLIDGVVSVRCNHSSLYVEPSFRSFAPLLIRRAERRKDVTYLNVTPSPHTWSMVEAQGYKRFSNGMFVAVPTLRYSWPYARTQVREATAEICWDARLQPFEKDLLMAHAKYGCVCVTCEFKGNLHLFVFKIRRKFKVPLAHLIYCRNQKDFIALAGPLGRFLGRRGIAFVILDSDGPVPGLVGRYFSLGPKYWKGPDPPHLGDLAYTELAMFGF